MADKTTVNRITLLGLLLYASFAWGQLPTVIQTQEALPCKDSTGQLSCATAQYYTGVSRTNDPVTVGFPIPDSAGINCGGACTVNTIAPALNIRDQNAAGTQLPSQFKVIGVWPDGNVKWVQLDAQASPTANANTQDTPDASNIVCKVGTTNGGVTCGAQGGNSTGTIIASDLGATISINTGAAQFTIKKVNFDLLDSCIVGGTQLCGTNSPGIVVMGPTADGTTTTCSSIAACNIAYQSSNDASSNAKIEENGPVKAVVLAEGALVNTGITYARYRARLYFYVGSTNVKVKIQLRVADEGGSGTFASAWKQHASYNIQLKPSLGASPAWAFGTDTTNQTGTFVGAESAYMYQGFSNFEEPIAEWKGAPNCPTGGGFCIVSPITRSGSGSTEAYAQSGYIIAYNGAVVKSGLSTVYPDGWGDIFDGSGNGILAGVKYIAGNWPKEIKLTTSLITVGLNPVQTDWITTCGTPTPCQVAYYQPWPSYKTDTVFLTFHKGALASETNTFRAQQYELIARAMGADGQSQVAYYNNATGCVDTQCSAKVGALEYPLITPTDENNFWIGIQNETACTSGTQVGCNPAGTRKWLNNAAVNDIAPVMERSWIWANPGSGNQHEKDRGYLDNRWLQRGQTGAYLTAAQFYRYEIDEALPHSDVACGTTHGTPLAQCGASADSTCGAYGVTLDGHEIFHFRCASTSYLDNVGSPGNVTSTNQINGYHSWANEGNGFEHAHWYGLVDYYNLTGDMFAYDAMLQAPMDWFAETRCGPTVTCAQHANNSDAIVISRAIGHFYMGAANAYRWAKDVQDPTNDTPTLLSMLQTTLPILVTSPDFCPSLVGDPGWQGGCRSATSPGQFTAGVSRTRGWGGGWNGTGGGNDLSGIDQNCPNAGPCGKPWMDGIMAAGMWDLQTLIGPSVLNGIGVSTTLLSDLMDGIGNWSDRESFIAGATGTWQDTKMSYDVQANSASPMIFSSPAGCIPGQTGCVVNSAVAQYEFNYYVLANYQGGLTAAQQQRFVANYLEWAVTATSSNPDKVDDHDMYESSIVISMIEHPPANSLSSLITPTGSPCTANASGQCTVSWVAPTPPTGKAISSYRLKDYSVPIKEWIGYEPLVASFSATARGCAGDCWGNPFTGVAWFAATEISPPAFNVTSFTVSGLTPGNTYNFGLKAVFGTSSPVTAGITTVQR